jgi:hypothetical protein
LYLLLDDRLPFHFGSVGHVGHVHEVETEQGGENCHHPFDQVDDCENGNQEKP